MTIGEACNRDVITVKADTAIAEAVMLMKTYHVGDLVVVERGQGRPVPVGILTDRDIALAVARYGVRLPHLHVSDLMSRELVTCREHESIHNALKQMETNGVRRLPVVAADGGLEGILTFDDVIELLSEDLTELARLVLREQKKERLHGLES